MPLRGCSRFRIPAPHQSRALRELLTAGCPIGLFIPQLHIPNHLPGRAPDVLEEAVLLCEPVEAVVALAHGTDEAAESVDLVLASVATILVNLANAQLDGGVVLGLDDAAGSRLRWSISFAFRRYQGRFIMALTHLRGT